MAACLLPSATLIADWRWPSDSVIWARLVRSAVSSCVIASWMSCCGVISRISIEVTVTPQRTVSPAILACRRLLISSRRASTSSTVMSPITARSEVVARLRTAMMKLLMLITAASASTT